MGSFLPYSRLQIKLEWSSQWGKMGMVDNMHGSRTKVYRVLVGKPEGKRPLRRTRHWLQDNFEINLREKE
jgi:hypothetical protein